MRLGLLEKATYRPAGQMIVQAQNDSIDQFAKILLVPL